MARDGWESWGRSRRLVPICLKRCCSTSRLLKDGAEKWGEGVPCWELETPRSGERTEIPQPDHPAALLTLQSRRIFLHRENDRVTGYSLLGGDFFSPEYAYCEQMTVWRGVQRSRNAPFVFLPKRHDPGKQFWREFPAVFMQENGIHAPGVVQWISRLQHPRIHLLDRGSLVRFRITGVEYGDKDFFVTDTFADELSFHADLLEDVGKGWRKSIQEEIARCESLAEAVGWLACDLAIAAGRDKDGSQKAEAGKAKEQFYFRVDQPFREWLRTIDPMRGEEENKILQWQNQAAQLARRFGEELVREAGTRALIGRSIEDRSKKGKNETSIKRHYSAPEAYNAFLSRIAVIYGKGGTA